MAASGMVVSAETFFQAVRSSGLVAADRLQQLLDRLAATHQLPHQPQAAAVMLVRLGVLSKFQAQQLLQGRTRGFVLGGKYKMLELLGQGGMGAVYLCEHTTLKRPVAVKILPADELAKDPALLERFYREARAVAALTHPNLVRAYDVDQDGKLHYLVMEFIDGVNLQELVTKTGPLPVAVAAHYIAQAAAGLQRAHSAGWVHRDIKPGNLLLDRHGTIKVLDLGLARLRNNQGDQLTQKYDDQATMGTADYLSPEQALNASDVDVRADLYSLGGTFYFLLAGQAPFADRLSAAQKLLAHQMQEPRSLYERRRDLPKELNLIVSRLLRKKPEERFQSPSELIAALEPWTQATPAPPPAEVLPKWTPVVKAHLANRPESVAPTSHPSVSLMQTVVESASPTEPLQGKPTPLPRRSSGRIARPKPSESAPPSEPAPGRPGKAAKPKRGRKKVRKLHPALVAGVLGVIVVACAAAIYFMASSTQPKLDVASRPTRPLLPHEIPGSPPAVGSQPPAPPPPVAAAPSADSELARLDMRQTFFVVDDPVQAPPGAVHKCATLAQALDLAPPGTRIVVLSETLRESLVLDDGRRGRGVTIEAAPRPDGKAVTWLPGSGLGRRPPLQIARVEGLVVRGFRLDGDDDAVDALITVTGHCPGLRIEECHFNQYKRTGLVLTDVRGASDAPVLLKRLRFETGQKNQRRAAIHLVGRQPSQGNEHIVITDCRFEGYFKAVLHIQGGAEFVRLERSRFLTPPPPSRDPKKEHQPSDVVLIEEAAQIRLTVANNTFLRYASGIHLQALPEADSGSRIVFRNNLILAMNGVVTLGTESDIVDEAALKKLFPSFEGNLCRPTACHGGLPQFRPTSVRDFERLSDRTDNDRTFLRYPRTSPLMRSGAGGEPVGAPPDADG
ncbi:MAG TPA: protein kinase [Gemmatales bacterium]|nr:protein kinase [Gemmatales bacterium]HMP58321.1 protein kinase [Gemmatales bacterium]